MTNVGFNGVVMVHPYVDSDGIAEDGAACRTDPGASQGEGCCGGIGIGVVLGVVCAGCGDPVRAVEVDLPLVVAVCASGGRGSEEGIRRVAFAEVLVFGDSTRCHRGMQVPEGDRVGGGATKVVGDSEGIKSRRLADEVDGRGDESVCRVGPPQGQRCVAARNSGGGGARGVTKTDDMDNVADVGGDVRDGE